MTRTSQSAPLDLESLLEEAARKSGLENFEDEGFRAPLSLLLTSCRESDFLTETGSATLRSVALRHLRNRLQVQAYLDEPDAVLDPPDEVVVVTGLPRTGTSLLHNLLAADRRHRFLGLWEGLTPVPPGRGGAPDEATLVSRAEAWLERFYEHAPDFRVIRDLSATGPEECDALLQNAFASQHFVDMFDADRYARWFYEGDLTSAYEYYALQLAVLGRGGRERWVLKSPGHLGHLRALLSALPRARVLHCHRDPQQAVVSYASLILAVRTPNCARVTPRAVGEQALNRSRAMLARGLEDRERAGAERFFDVSFSRLTSDPLAAVREIYEWLGTPLHGGAEREMRKWLEGHPRNRRGVHRYDAADFGLERRAIAESLSFYLDRFGLFASG